MDKIAAGEVDKHAMWDWDRFSENGVVKYNCEPISIYLENTDQPLWYADSLVAEFLKEKYYRDSARWAKGISEYDIDNLDGFYYYGGYDEWVKPFEDHYSAKNTFPFPYNPKGVDMSKPDVRERLVQAGYTSDEASEQIMVHQRRERIIQRRRDREKALKDQQRNEARVKNIYSTAFQVNQLGWVNLDRFYNDPKAKEVELYVAVETEADSIGYVSVTMVLPRLKLAINATLTQDGRYRFTGDSERYRKLPIGETAVIIGMSSNGETPYLETRILKIKKKQEVSLEMKPTTWDELKAELKKLG